MMRDAVTRFVYKNVLKRIFFLLDPEDVHERMTRAGALMGKFAVTRWLNSLMFSYSHPALRQGILGITFPNPVGLAGGFDKDAQLTDILPAVGFGFVEVGSITGEPCEGNPRPRLWRMKKSQSILVYYGLKNRGCVEIAKRLRKKEFSVPIGINIAKTNNPRTIGLKEGVSDYVKAYKAMSDIGAYTTINISCPNAFGGEPFTDPKKLGALLSAIDKLPKNKPIFLKISPDLSKNQLDDVLDVSEKHKVDGYICTNLTKSRKNSKILDKVPFDKGGFSGKVVTDRANSTIRYVYKRTRGKKVIIGLGGIFSAEDAYEKIKAGSSLVQLITGLIFEGPQVVSEINHGLVKILEKDGYKNISEAVGKDHI